MKHKWEKISNKALERASHGTFINSNGRKRLATIYPYYKQSGGKKNVLERQKH